MKAGETMAEVFIFFAGLAVGSFLNAVASRFPREESLWRPPSCCPACQARLKPLELIPLLSFVVQKGRCRQCGIAIPVRYPLLEVACAAVFLVCFSFFGLGLFFWKYIVLFSFLLVISVIDLERGIVPNRLVLLSMAWLLLWQLAGVSFVELELAMFGFLLGGGFFFLIAFLSKGGMGAGDVKLMAVLGFGSGWPYVVLVFLVSFILGGLIGAVLLAAGRKTARSTLPFAPFMALSHFVVTFWGVEIWKWYVSSF